MSALQLTAANYGRPRVGLPTTRMVNAYVEKTDEGPTGAARIPRPGLTLQYTIGSGPILRQYQKPGAFGGSLFSISGGNLYKDQTLVGSVAYSQSPRMAAANGSLAIVSGGGLYVYSAGVLTAVQFFDDGVSRLPSFSGVAVLYNIFIFPVAGSTEFFFSAVGDPTKINAANFSNAQTSPDPIIEVQVLAEELLFFKSTAIEFWDYNGALTAPFALSTGRTYARGCAAQGSVVQLDNAMFWVGQDYSVYRSGAVPTKISTPVIDDRIRAASTGVTLLNQMTAYAVEVEGHVFYVMNLPAIGESYAYDCQTQLWAQWGTLTAFSPEPGLFEAQTCAGQGSQTWLGSGSSGKVYLLDVNNATDNGASKRVVVSGYKWTGGGMMRCNNISLHCVRGVGNAAVPNPVVEMRFSDDGGRTFSSWFQSILGPQGAYDYKAVWRSLGLIQQPGRLFEFAVSDPVNFTVEGASINEARI